MSGLTQPRCLSCYGFIEPDLVSFGSDQCRTCRDPGAAAQQLAQSVSLTVPAARRRRRETMTQGMLIWALASAALMIIGAFGPWAKVLVVSINGTDASRDAWVVASAGFFGGLLVYVRRADTASGAWALLAGVIGALPAVYVRQHLKHWISDSGPTAQAWIHVGWGLDVAVVASISLAVAGAAGLIRRVT
jgi:hypothetical protein